MTATSSRAEHDDGRCVAGDTDASSLSMHRIEIMSNADLYNTMTPPAYTLSVADGEESIDAEAYVPEKTPRRPSSSHTEHAASHPLQQSQTAASASASHAPLTLDMPPDYFTELTDNAAAAHVKRCSILRERPATWLVKKKDMALCPLVATLLIKEGLLRAKDIELSVQPYTDLDQNQVDKDSISRSAGVKRDPTDPLSAVAFGVYDTVGDILLGLVQGPVELGRQVAPMMQKYEAKQHGNLKDTDEGKRSGDLTPSVRHSVRQESSPLVRPDTARSASTLGAIQEGVDGDVRIKLQPDSSNGFQNAQCYSDAESSKSQSRMANAPHAAKQVAVGTGKGLGRIVGAGLKAPMTFTHGMTRGFHNMPKLYGEEVRQHENVTDLKSGLLVSAKGLGYGLTDGLKDFFVKPVQGAQKEGVIGFGKGFGKGIGNLVCKPAAGAIGIIGYSSVGVYKECQKIGNLGKKDPAVEVVEKLGEAEYEQASEEVLVEVVKKWCQFMMKQK